MRLCSLPYSSGMKTTSLVRRVVLSSVPCLASTIFCLHYLEMSTISGGTIYRVIRNDCRGFNNLSYTIQLREEYVVAPMDLENLSFLLWCVACSSYAFLRLERSLPRWRRTAVRRRFLCLHFIIVLMFVESQSVHI